MVNIGIVSDIHYGYSGLDSDTIIEALHRVVDAFKSQDVNDVILLGDLIHEVSEEDDVDNLELVYELFAEEFETVIAIGGNHDCANLNGTQFSEIVQNPITTKFVRGDTSLLFLDTAFQSEIQNIGQIDGAAIDLVDNLSGDEKSIIFTHFPVTYTEAYQDNEYFCQYPEAVFAINKYYLTEVRDKDTTPHINKIVSGHLHTPAQYTDSLGTPNSILTPFSEVRIDPPTDSFVRGASHILDTETLEITQVTESL